MLLSEERSYTIIFQLGRDKQYFQNSILMTSNTKLKSKHTDVVSGCDAKSENGMIKQASGVHL